MNLKNKRGQSNMFGKVIGVIFGIFLIMVFIFSAMNWSGSSPGQAIGTGFTETSDVFLNIFGPLFNALLGTDKVGGDNGFLMILTFILVAIVVIGTLDSVNIFGDANTTQTGWMNFGIGIIVAVIGVRFMPVDIWASLTAPANAFVATILVGLPFAALFFVSMKMKSNLVRKLLWIFYLVFMSYLIFFPQTSTATTNGFMWIYIIFLFLAGVMMFFDGTVVKFFYKEKREAELQRKIGRVSLVDRHRLTKKIEEAKTIYDEAIPSTEEKKAARVYYSELKRQLKEMDDFGGPS